MESSSLFCKGMIMVFVLFKATLCGEETFPTLVRCSVYSVL